MNVIAYIKELLLFFSRYFEMFYINCNIFKLDNIFWKSYLMIVNIKQHTCGRNCGCKYNCYGYANVCNRYYASMFFSFIEIHTSARWKIQQTRLHCCDYQWDRQEVEDIQMMTYNRVTWVREYEMCCVTRHIPYTRILHSRRNNTRATSRKLHNVARENASAGRYASTSL